MNEQVKEYIEKGLIPFKDHLNIDAQAINQCKEELADYSLGDFETDIYRNVGKINLKLMSLFVFKYKFVGLGTGFGLDLYKIIALGDTKEQEISSEIEKLKSDWTYAEKLFAEIQRN